MNRKKTIRRRQQYDYYMHTHIEWSTWDRQFPFPNYWHCWTISIFEHRRTFKCWSAATQLFSHTRSRWHTEIWLVWAPFCVVMPWCCAAALRCKFLSHSKLFSDVPFCEWKKIIVILQNHFVVNAQHLTPYCLGWIQLFESNYFDRYFFVVVVFWHDRRP